MSSRDQGMEIPPSVAGDETGGAAGGLLQTMREPADAREQSLLALLACLAVRGYRFTTISPASHARVLARRPGALASDLRDVRGWARPVQAGTRDAEVETLLDRAGAGERVGDTTRATVRVSSLGRELLLHSAYPTEAEDAVFFGPASYLFAAAVEAE